MKRTPLRPGRTGLKQGKPLQRRTELQRGPRIQPGTHPRQYGKVRRWVEARAGGRCEIRVEGVCTGRGVHAHHIKPRSAGRDDSMGNLAWCCGECHAFVHANPTWSYEHGWLRRRGPVAS